MLGDAAFATDMPPVAACIQNQLNKRTSDNKGIEHGHIDCAPTSHPAKAGMASSYSPSESDDVQPPCKRVKFEDAVPCESHAKGEETEGEETLEELAEQNKCDLTVHTEY